ncbi:hypothetical protein T06_15385 [Trichinella sp. T6]|nr:hypothetical protein T06_15385 [Trichinella sp. T6]
MKKTLEEHAECLNCLADLASTSTRATVVKTYRGGSRMTRLGKSVVKTPTLVPLLPQIVKITTSERRQSTSVWEKFWKKKNFNDIFMTPLSGRTIGPKTIGSGERPSGRDKKARPVAITTRPLPAGQLTNTNRHNNRSAGRFTDCLSFCLCQYEPVVVKKEPENLPSTRKP